MDKNCNMRAGFQNISYWMRAAKRYSTLLLCLAALTFVGCGEPGLPGLGEVSVSGGADLEFSSTKVASGGVCDFSGQPFFVQLFVTKEDADLGQSVFGSDTLFDIQDGPANIEVLTNANVTILNVSTAFRIQHSTQPASSAFDDPATVLTTNNGIATVSTGPDGVSFLRIALAPGAGTIPAGAELETFIGLVPSALGAGIQVDFTFTCDAP